KRYEISPYFFACLVMANTYNVHVNGDVQVDNKECPSIVKVSLLKKGRHHEIFESRSTL
ncbi:hypothetical protein Angca_002035, partial [Angiostrongylus cantonensis]